MPIAGGLGVGGRRPGAGRCPGSREPLSDAVRHALQAAVEQPDLAEPEFLSVRGAAGLPALAEPGELAGQAPQARTSQARRFSANGPGTKAGAPDWTRRWCWA